MREIVDSKGTSEEKVKYFLEEDEAQTLAIQALAMFRLKIHCQ